MFQTDRPTDQHLNFKSSDGAKNREQKSWGEVILVTLDYRQFISAITSMFIFLIAV